jgi:hypothetical protein
VANTPNSAKLLADMLDSFTVPRNSAAQSVHGFESANDLPAWRRHIEALALVRTVEDTLLGMRAAGKDVEVFEHCLPGWWAGVGMATTPWGSATGSARSACSDHDLAMLKALAFAIDANGYTSIDEYTRRTLADVLEEAETLLDDDSNVPADVATYLGGLLRRARMVLDNVHTYGADALRSVATELGGAMVMQGQRAKEAGDEPTGNRWQANAYLAMAGFFGGLGSESAGALIAGVGKAAKQITTGAPE